jgi:transcriptional adapter 1
MFVVTWESGLDSLSDDSVTLINLAVRDFIKNVMTSIISFKRGFQTTHSGFKHFFGTSLFDPLLANSREVVEAEDDFVMMDSFDDSEQKAVMLTACTREEDLNDRKPLSLWDTFYALRKYRQTIPSHSLYSINLARIMTRLHDSEEYQRAQRLAN